MKIKRYTAASMRAALDQVRTEQGPDSVILSSRRVEEGIEVIAAVDYDEALMAGAARQYAPADSVQPPAAPPPAVPSAPARAASTAESSAHGRRPALAAPAPSAVLRAAAPAGQPAGPAVQRAPDAPVPREGAAPRTGQAPAVRRASAADVGSPGLAHVQRELKDLRALLENELAHISWHDKRQRDPQKARVLEALSAMDIAPDVAARLAAAMPPRTNLEDPSKLPLALLLRALPVLEQPGCVNPGVFALVGPTGAGKTTTIAKLAARWTMKHGSADLALVSTDAYRIGAREQLMTYARILGAPMYAPNSGRELARVLERLRSKRLVLIDTAGMGPRDERLREQLAALKLGAARARVLLALPAQGEGHALEEIMRAFAGADPSACVLTKLDEAASLGAVISTTLRHGLKIAYLCNGQRVPEDVHSAHQRRVWLVRTAHKLKEHAPPRRDDAYYARNFGRAHAHA